MKRTLALVGAGTLFLWTVLGFVAWSSVAQRVTVTCSDHELVDADAPRLSALADELGALRQDVRALAQALGENFQALNDELLASQTEHAAALELRVNALRDEVGSLTSPPSSAASSTTDEPADLMREPGVLRDALQASAAPGSAARPFPVAAAPAPAAGKPQARKSFLAFELPSDDFRFDERRTWAVLPALSRIGFDARTTLHDFTATTSVLEGELEADLSKSGETPRARLAVQAATLASGDAARDEEMRARLSVEQHPTLEFELTRFEPDEMDAAALRASGVAHGRMRVHGVTQEVAMRVKLSIDAARRLCVEGEMALDLTRFGVPVPNKLGLITMEKEVKVWISLRLRAHPRSAG